METSDPQRALLGGPAGRLLRAAMDLAATRELGELTAVVRHAARELVGSDGVCFILREGELVHYVDEEAIAPLWKGRRFPVRACVSGWAMLHRCPAVIEDITADPRVPLDAYRTTFVKSLAMVPVGPGEPVAAIGAYWARLRRASDDEVALLQALAGLAAPALANHALNAQLRRAAEQREEMVTIASHELRTPIAAMQLQLARATREAARAGGAVPAPLSQALGRMRRSVERLGRLAGELVDVSRLAHGPLPLEREPLDLADLTAPIVRRAQEAGQSVVTLSAEGSAAGVWDRERLEAIVENVLANAVKFGLGRPVEVRLAGRREAVTLTVRDHGIGIAPADQDRIFERFERAASSRHYGGFGLGLWLTRRYVEAHGGTVEVRSAPGEGATFEIVLPRHPPGAPSAPAPAPAIAVLTGDAAPE